MSDIIRDSEDLPGHTIVNVTNLSGDKVDVDHEELEELEYDDLVDYPTAHSSDAMILNDVFPGYEP